MKNFVSAGCFTIHKKGNNLFVLLIHRQWDKKTSGWVPPKGTVEENESPEEAAIRETIEETSVEDVKLISFIGSSHYSFPFEGGVASKIVHWYLAESKLGKLGQKHLSEHEKTTLDQVDWVEIREALKILQYENERNILTRIMTDLNNPNLDLVDSYYRKYTTQNIGHYSAETDYYSKAKLRPVEEKLLHRLSIKDKILDVGCGAGRFSINAALLGYKIVGIDVASKAIAEAKNLAKSNNLNNIQFIETSMTKLPFADNTFNNVVCIRYSLNSVPTFENRRTAIAEMVRVTARGGTIYIETQNMFYLGDSLSKVLPNIFVRYLFRYLNIFIHKLLGIAYVGLLPGDFVYSSGKIKSAPAGYLHLPSVFEIKAMIPKNAKVVFTSTPEILSNDKKDLFKYWRYSLWTIITKN